MSSNDKYDAYEQVASIKVIGVGGAGNNAVNRMIEAGVQGVDFIVANTDAQVLSVSKAKQKIILGKEVSKGLGAGANPEVGREAAIESTDELREVLKNADMVFIAAGMGGGTGTGAAPVIAKIAKEIGALTVGIITTPFRFEGKTRNGFAIQGVNELRKNVDSLIIISNDRLLQVIGGVPLKDSFKEADNILRQGVQTITDLIAVPSLINLDFADVKNVMRNKGNALFGIGIGEGPDKAIEAANKAIISPLLDASIRGAKDAIINVTGGSTITLNDANDAVDIVRQAINGEVNIIFGVAINENLEDEMIVTVIATGFDQNVETDDQSKVTSPSNTNSQFSNKNVVNPLEMNLKQKKDSQESVTAQPPIYNFKDGKNLEKTEIPSQFLDPSSANDDDDLPPFLRKKW